MHVLVRQQAGGELAGRVVDETTLVHAAVVGLVVLEAEVGDVVAERVEKMVVAVVVRAEQLLRLVNQGFVVVPRFLLSVKRGGAVGGDIHFGGRSLRQRDDFQKFSGDDGRIDQRGERHRGEVDFTSGLIGNREWGAELPSSRKFQRGGVVDVVGLVAFGVQQDLVPTDDGELVGGRGAGRKSAFESGRGEIVKFGVDFGDPGGNFDVQGPAVEQVAAPLERVSSGAELQAGEIDHGAVGCVLPGNPLRIVEREVARSGGNLQRGVENFAWCGGSINGDRDVRRSGGKTGKRKDKKAEDCPHLAEFHSCRPLECYELIPTVRI